MCSTCLHAECPPSCPNSQEPKKIGYCGICNTKISECDVYTKLEPQYFYKNELKEIIYICEECIGNCESSYDLDNVGHCGICHTSFFKGETVIKLTSSNFKNGVVYCCQDCIDDNTENKRGFFDYYDDL